MQKTVILTASAVLLGAQLVLVDNTLGHGDVTPQEVDTGDLRKLPEGDFALENPYRLEGGAQYALAQEIGSSAYSQNCARCHGLQAVSGGIAPDLRKMEEGEFGDEWFMERVINGYTQNGATKMPAFSEILTQEAMWAIRSYTENQPL